MNCDISEQNVSRETFDDLRAFHDLLVKWNPKINLVSKSSVPHLWNRHIWDSAQIVEFAKNETRWLDIGSGGGFPALVVAIFAKHSIPERKVTLVESDQRKSAFLRTVVRELSLNAAVLSERIEKLSPQNVQSLSARALADLSLLLDYSEKHLANDGTAFFLKGETWEKEVQIARESWSFNMKVHKSKTNPAAAILEVKEIQRV